MLICTSGAAAFAGENDVDTSGGKSSRKLFQERINSILSAPLPRCLQSTYPTERSSTSQSLVVEDCAGRKDTTHSGTTSASLSFIGQPEGKYDRFSSPQVEHEKKSRSTSRCFSTGHRGMNNKLTTSPPEPIYEQLLRKGRLQQEHREQLRQAAIEREVAKLRPAPHSHVAGTAISVGPPQPVRRLPPEGQRIEDKLLQRARDKAERERKEAELRKLREEEDLAAVATFHPHISAHAQATKARYTEPPPDRAAWRAKRLEELAQVRQSAELQELQEGPVINKRSAKLAAERRVREGLEGLPASEALHITEHRRRLAQWQAAEAERVACENASPAITHRAASIHRVGGVGWRLHAESYEAAVRRLQREVKWREAHTPFHPDVTALAAVTAPRYQRKSNDFIAQAASAMLRGGGSSNTRDNFQPTINPVSAAIAARLPESSMQRLCRSGAVHSLSSYIDPSRSLDTSAVVAGAAAETVSCGQQTPRNQPQARLDMTTPLVPPGCSPASAIVVPPGESSPSSSSPLPLRPPPPLPSAVVASLDAYERRRQARLDALRYEQSAQEMRECTFQPQVNPRSAAIVNQTVCNNSADDSSIGERRGLAAVARRSEAWQQQRERHLATVRQWQAERAAAELVEIPTQHRPAVHQESSTARSVYGGDGRAWGVVAYLARQQLARAQRQERQGGPEHCTMNVSDVSNPAAASALTTPLQFSRPSGDSTIRSLGPSVAASQASTSAQLWS